MPKKGRYADLAKFPPNRIKKIMQTDKEVGKLAQPVPVMVARSLELFAKSLLLAAGEVAQQAGARTLTPLHLKTAVEEDERLDFLRCKVEDLQKPGSDDHPSSSKKVKERNGSSDMKFASLMAHEDADLDLKSTGRLGVKEEKLKVKPVSKKKRSQPENVSTDVESKQSSTMMQSSLPLKHYISNAIVPPQQNKLKPQDIDEDYDNI